MAGFRTHITVSSAAGIAFGAAAVTPLGFTAETGFLAAAVTAVGGMLPDLDSDSGVPVRELSALSAVALPILLIPRLTHAGMSTEGILAFLAGMYLFLRYGVSWVISRISVHRGMFHSIPAMLISGLVIYLEYDSPDRRIRLILAGGVMLGFLSHLILDEIYSVDFNGLRPRLSKSAGSAVKLASPSWTGTMACYAILVALAVVAYAEWMHSTGQLRPR